MGRNGFSAEIHIILGTVCLEQNIFYSVTVLAFTGSFYLNVKCGGIHELY